MATLSVKSVVLGDPASPRHQINPFELSTLLEQIQNLASLNSSLYFEDTISDLQGVASPAEGSIGFVLDDDPNTGTYRYESGAWVLTAALPKAMASAAQEDTTGFAVLRQSYLPGDTPQNFTQTTTGPANETVDAVGTVEESITKGAFFRLTGAKQIAVRERVRIEDGKRYQIEWSAARHQDPTDPAGDTVRFGVVWLDGLKQTIQDQIIEDVVLTTSMGEFNLARFVVEDASFSNELSPPEGAVYMVPYTKTFGADGQTDILKLGFEPISRVARTFYVTVDGDDENQGTSLYSPLATIGEALSRAKTLGLPCSVIVMPGEYVVQPDTEIPENCLLYGYDLRVTKLSLPEGQEVNNMFLMTSGIKVRGFTFTNLRHDNYTFNTVIENFSPPTKGFAFTFKPGAKIIRSPYIADCSMLHNFSQLDLTRPMDRENGNPDMPVGGGNIYCDGSVLDADSPLRSVVVDSFTSINPNGVAYVMRRNAFAQLVSVFTNWSRVGLWCHEGGQMTVANSNNTFGDYALVATGFRRSILIPDTRSESLSEQNDSANVILSFLDEIVEASLARIETLPDYRPSYEELTRRDTRTLLYALAFDLQSGQDRATQRFTKGFFNWNGSFAFDSSLADLFKASWQEIKAELDSRISSNQARNMINVLLDIPTQVFSDVQASGSGSQYLIAFPSKIEATGQQFSNAGSGINYNALPSSQRGTGGNPDPRTAIIQALGGRVYATFSTEVGDTYLGQDLRVDFERSTIEGQAFSRGVQNIALPLIIGTGG